MKRIGIIDYGMGNLHSVIGAFNYIGCNTFVSSETTELDSADALILPGVGAFPDAMKNLQKYNLVQFIQYEAKKKPMLGICLGMQLLFECSYEFVKCSGLGLIKGEVIKLTASENKLTRQYKIPHMGWNSLDIKINSPLTDNLPDKSHVYFVHSYKGVTTDLNDLIASTEYGEQISAIVNHGNVYGTQFHPEKSESIGLQILNNFVGML